MAVVDDQRGCPTFTARPGRLHRPRSSPPGSRVCSTSPTRGRRRGGGLARDTFAARRRRRRSCVPSPPPSWTRPAPRRRPANSVLDNAALRLAGLPALPDAPRAPRSRCEGARCGMSRVAVIGTGYVGLTTGAYLAHIGHEVVCADVDEDKVAAAGIGATSRSSRQGLEELVRAGLDDAAGCRSSSGSEPRRPGRRVRLPLRADAPGRRRRGRPLLHRAGGGRDRPRCSPPTPSSSTSRPCRSARRRLVSGPSAAATSSWCPTPSSCREGSAVHDCLNPDRIVIGADDPAAAVRVAALYERIQAPLIVTDPAIGRADQVRLQRLPRHQDQLHQRHRQPVRGRRRRRPRRRARHGLRQAHRLRVPAARPGMGRLLLSEGHPGPGADRRGRRLRLRAAARRHRRQRRAVRAQVVDRVAAAGRRRPRRGGRRRCGA